MAGASCRESMAHADEDHRDTHSYARPDEVRVRHVDLDLNVDFAQKTLRGTVTLHVKRNDENAPLRVDTRDLAITQAETSQNGRDWTSTRFELGASDKILGAPLSVTLPAGAGLVRIHYATSPGASALQWLEPAQTAGKQHPFLFTQSQAIHARSWIPLQDTPGVRITYSAHIRTPNDLVAVMSAEKDPDGVQDGDYSFRMRQPVPSYLVALAVGDLAFRPMSDRTGVWAEPSLVEKAAAEFNDTEKMMQAAESMFGPYQWERYDILVLPPSFPFGGMENPRLTFATPTVIAGDKSLVALVAHELAHSWSGNLVTNATWRDFWLNEGFTVYLERRIQEKVFGRERAQMEEVIEVNELRQEMKQLAQRDQVLHINLDGRDPDDGFSNVPYVKGALFLRQLEQTFGRKRFDAFLTGYFNHFQFQSITTGDFLTYLKKNLLDENTEAASKIPLEEWMDQAGLPASAPEPQSEAFRKVDMLAERYMKGQTAVKDLPVKQWSTQEWLHFLRALPERLDPARLRDLDAAFGLTRSGNSEIASQWLLMSIRSGYTPAFPRLEDFLETVGRRKFLKPLYEELVKTPEGRQRALAIYAKARPGYHPIAATSIDTIVKP